MVYGNSTSYLSINKIVSTCNPCINFSVPAYSVAYMVNFLVGAPANVWVLWLMLFSTSFRTDKMEAFEFSLAVNDLLYTFTSPVVLVGFLYFEQFPEYLLAAAQSLMYQGRSFFQTCICLERYLAVVHPVVFLKLRPLRYRVAILAPMWLINILVCFVFSYMCLRSSTTLTYVFSLYQFFVFSINSFFCFSILWALFRPGPGDGKQRGGGEGEKEGMNLIKKRAFTTVLIIEVAVVFAYLPDAVSMLLFMNMSLKTFCIFNCLFYFFNVVMGLVLPVLHLRRAGKLKLDFLRQV